VGDLERLQCNVNTSHITHRTGLGAFIMGLVHGMAEKIEVEKIMLSVWTRNEKAVAFYRRMGFDKDEFSPEPRVLRNGSVKECEYLIMSKAVGLL